MRFNLVDRIIDWEAGKSLRAVKHLTLAEEFLADHFPSFPVMPGVLMLEALTEASAWLWRLSTDFQHSVIVLRDVKNVKYGSFLQPGKSMNVQVDLLKVEGDLATFKGKGTTEEGTQTVTAQLILNAYNTRDRLPHGSTIDDKLIQHWKERCHWLTRKKG